MFLAAKTGIHCFNTAANIEFKKGVTVGGRVVKRGKREPGDEERLRTLTKWHDSLYFRVLLQAAYPHL